MSRAASTPPPARVASGSGAYALLADGTSVHVRPAGPGDADAVGAFFDRLPPRSRYLRFFGTTGQAGRDAVARLCPANGEPAVDALLACVSDELVGVVEHAASGRAGEREVALTVAVPFQQHGVATLLLEHLVTAARARGVRYLVGEALGENQRVLEVFASLGLPATSTLRAGTVRLTVTLEPDAAHLESYLEAVAERERGADVASLRHVLAPSSVAVVGASRRPGSVGHAVLSNLRQYQFTGTLVAVNPHAEDIDGVPCYPSVTDLPETPELVVVAVPPQAAISVADECGRRGVRALVVLTAGFDAESGPRLLATVRRHGMRLVGPNCLGVTVTTAGTRLNATFGAGSPPSGPVGLAVQSGGVGIALCARLAQLGLGISSFVSLGDKYDVSANDLLLWWQDDPATRVGVIYVESFGNPRKFARTARRVARRLPLLTVNAGRSEAGQRAAASHTAAAATQAATRSALFTQAGLIATRSLAELSSAAALLVTQPLPAGNRVAVVSNAGGAGVLAADACVEAGLSVPVLPHATRAEVAALLPAGAAVGNPVDATAAVTASTLRQAVSLLAASDAVDAVLVLLTPTALGELDSALTEPTPRGGKPILGVLAGQAETVVLREGSGERVPCYADPADAARALGYAHQYAAWLARPSGRVPDLPEVDRERAARLVADFLSARPEGGWLDVAGCAALVDCYHIPLTPGRVVHDLVEAVQAAQELGMPAVLKAVSPDLLHKSAAGGVETELSDESAVRAAYQRLTSRFGHRLRGVLVQAMAAPGVEVLAGVTHDPVFGPLVAFGAGGVATDVLADHALRLTPLTDRDVDALIDEVRVSRLLRGYSGHAAGDLTALRGLLLRLGRLADDLPQVAEVDLNPVIVRPDGVCAVDARVRLHPAEPRDPYLRKLRDTTPHG